MAGHSKWANIKHRKARQDAKRSRMWSRCARAIIVAARQGGPDPAANLALRYAVDEAKSANMPKDTIEKAIAKGSGETGGEAYEAVVYEGYGPNGVAILVETLTDNRNRTAGEVRHAFEKHGGNLGTSGSVAFVFNQKGLITVDKSDADEDRIMELALEAGAADATDEGDYWQIETEPTDFHAVREAVRAAGIEPQMAELSMIPTTTVECAGDTARKVLRLIDALEDLDDTQHVHANYDIPEAEMAALES